jgi:hypothetical protein
MRTIWLWSLSLLLLCCSGVSSASTLTYWYPQWASSNKYSSAYLACRNGSTAQAQWVVYNNGTFTAHDGVSSPAGCHRKLSTELDYSYIGSVLKGTTNCPFGDNGSICNASCDPPNSMVDGQCVAPEPSQCESSADQQTGWKKVWPSYDAYNSDSSKPKCVTSQNGCAVDICGAGGSMQCGQSSATGEYACFGNGTYTGEEQDESTGGDVEGCEGSACEPPPPSNTTADKSCTAPQVSSGTTTYTCISESNSDQWASSNCAVGEVNGVTGLHCTKPDYVPEGHQKTKTDNVTETQNPDGGKTTKTESTVTETKCKAGVCTTTTTTTTTTSTSDAEGNTTEETTECEGDKCDNPATPEDESQEEEEGERTVSGDDCSGTLACEGDAIDCAILKQQKLQRCSMDWETQKSAVLSEAGKDEYQLQTDEVDVGDLFSGPSTARWLTASCPADRTVHLSLTGTSIVFSWQFICDYASGLGNLLVALASLFFAVYVGRAWGG